MESKENFDIHVKRKINTKQFTIGLVLLSATLFNILIDYVKADFSASIFFDVAYWIKLITTNGAILLIMLSFRGYMKERELTGNADILSTQKDIDGVHVELSRRNLATSFENHVNEINADRKLTAYKNVLKLKLSKATNDKSKRKILDRLDKAEEEISFRKVKYPKVKISTIFSKTKLNKNDDEDMEDGEERQIGQLLVNKVIGIVGFGVLGASLAFELNGFSVAVIINTVIKLFQTAYAIYAGGSDGQNFVKSTILSKMKLRLNFVQKFIESKKGEQEHGNKELTNGQEPNQINS